MINNAGNILTAQQNPNSTSFFGYAGRVFAFNTVGEYRIIYGNLSSDYGEFQIGVNCNTAGQQDLRVNGQLEIGDFYYPGFEWRGDNDGVYEYQVSTSSTSCLSPFPSNATLYYAAEPFAKYVTQLYTDVSLINQAFNAGTIRFRRMETRGSSAVSNPERTKDGAYTATFSQGARSSDSTPCLF